MRILHYPNKKEKSTHTRKHPADSCEFCLARSLLKSEPAPPKIEDTEVEVEKYGLNSNGDNDSDTFESIESEKTIDLNEDDKESWCSAESGPSSICSNTEFFLL